MLELVSAAVDLVHALAMLLWGIGLPLLFWHRWPRLSRVYVVYSVFFVGASVVSQLVLGECFLTTLARDFAEAGTNSALRDRTSFTVRLVEAVAGMRPTERTAVLFWQLAIFVTSIGMLFHLRRGRPHAPPPRALRWR